ncbi:MAG: phosphatidylglycerophosphatase A [Candidatus Scalindua rubra]|uniref:Phosphatidylglycerophosphatase n=1 Tax=Candidatus Scalindua brodae TaxID=237368 RepID=A0A0B0EFK9_9BACT|nr:MAG: phosphatidylglycerophosphatase [Candidatus Scalindua brodae]MBZ0109862.1 phosphatidylglycerophosphatase A [Candidatus Scalindua rubra]TWU28720.1 Phosphatidylglycerophosphatase A [Candidatus Brocadiaceae bacterium S225]
MNKCKHNISWIIATWFGSGLLPKAPGTWGSLAAFPFAYIISVYACPYALIFGIVALFFIGIWASDKIEESAQIKDPGFIVVDEVVGQWIALLPLPFLYSILGPNYFYLYSAPITVVAFIAFRIFDIWKPWPVNYADKNVPGGYGIMLDDVIAGMYALIVTSVLTAGMVMVLVKQ